MIRLGCLLIVVVVPALASEALAHKPSDSYLRLDLVEQRAPERSLESQEEWRGHWDLSLRDLDRELVLDADGDGQLTWGELRARESAVLAHALAGLKLSTPAGPCMTTAAALQITRHTDGAYARLPVQVRCPATSDDAAVSRSLTVEVGLFFGRDAQHRTLVELAGDPAVAGSTLILTAGEPRQTATLAGPSASASASPSPCRLRARGDLAHLDGPRPRAVPAGAAVAGGASARRPTAGCR